MKISIILGTRPEIIKFSPIIREFGRLGQEICILHTGQHYTFRMDRVFFKQLGILEANYNLDAGSGTHAEQTARILVGTENYLLRERPDVVLLEGDTNTVLAGALAAVKLGIRIGHVEAGLRSHDRQMPEEINRIIADHCSDLLFAPTIGAKKTLLSEGIPASKIFVTGNTIVDAVHQHLEMAKKKLNLACRLSLEPRTYFLATIHRQENVDNIQRFSELLKSLEMINQQFGYPVVYPIHPRAKKQLKRFKLGTRGIKTVEPLDYLSFLNLENNASLVLTDSGGVQEEACILRVPCVTLRQNTERPETIDVGANLLAGTDPDVIVRNVHIMLDRKWQWKNPFGDGKASERIVRILVEKLERPGAYSSKDPVLPLLLHTHY